MVASPPLCPPRYIPRNTFYFLYFLYMIKNAIFLFAKVLSTIAMLPTTKSLWRTKQFLLPISNLNLPIILLSNYSVYVFIILSYTQPCPNPSMIVRPIRNNCCPPPTQSKKSCCKNFFQLGLLLKTCSSLNFTTSL